MFFLHLFTIFPFFLSQLEKLGSKFEAHRKEQLASRLSIGSNHPFLNTVQTNISAKKTHAIVQTIKRRQMFTGKNLPIKIFKSFFYLHNKV